MTTQLTETDIRAILRAAEEIIARGGRTLLAKILKGSREQKIFQLGLDYCPTYGFFKADKLDSIMERIDWMLDHDFLDIEYDNKLPMIVFTNRGWEIERDQYVDEFLQEWNEQLEDENPPPDMYYLKDRNRQMILLFLEKIKETGDQKYIPYLKAWEKIDYKKVRAAIQVTIKALKTNILSDHNAIKERQDSIQQALKGATLRDLRLKCIECGRRFNFSVEEQRLFRQKGFVHPKRCQPCREKRNNFFVRT